MIAVAAGVATDTVQHEKQRLRRVPLRLVGMNLERQTVHVQRELCLPDRDFGSPGDGCESKPRGGEAERDRTCDAHCHGTRTF